MRVHLTVSRSVFAAVAAVFPFLSASCDRRDPPAAGGVAHPAANESAVAAFFREGPILPGASREELAGRLGAPDSTRVRTVTNRHDPEVTDSVLTLFHDGLIAEIHRAGYDGKEILSSLVILDDRYLQPGSPIRLGSSAAEVRAVLGAADDETADMLLYVCEDCLVAGQETVSFGLDGATVHSMEVRFWVD